MLGLSKKLLAEADNFAAGLMVAAATRFAASTIFFWLAPTSTLTPTRRFYHFLLVGADIYADADTPLPPFSFGWRRLYADADTLLPPFSFGRRRLVARVGQGV